jgi:hypothetical protein
VRIRHHRRYKSAVEELLDGELPPSARADVLLHLDECWDCSAAAETLLLIKHTFARLRRQVPSSLAGVRLRRFVDELTAPR